MERVYCRKLTAFDKYMLLKYEKDWDRMRKVTRIVNLIDGSESPLINDAAQYALLIETEDTVIITPAFAFKTIEHPELFC